MGPLTTDEQNLSGSLSMPGLNELTHWPLGDVAVILN